MSLEVVPILVAGTAATVVGVLWYVMFATTLKNIRPLTPAEEAQAQSQMTVMFGVGVLFTLLMAVVLFHVVTISDIYPAIPAVNGFLTALWIYVGFVMPVQATHIVFGNYGELGTKLRLFGVNTGGQLLSLLTMGLVIGLMK